MSVLDTIFFSLALLLAQAALAVVLVTVFMRMRIAERDTRLKEEEGRTPELEVTGGGQIGRGRWSMRPLCRLTLYDTFLVASIKSQRMRVNYQDIDSASIEVEKKRTYIHILGPKEDGRHNPDIQFAPKDPQTLEAALKEKIPNKGN